MPYPRMKRPVACPRCGEVRMMKPSTIARGGKFCSRLCAYRAKAESAPARFWSRVTRGDGCWEYQGALLLNGYGTVRLEASTHMLAHRYSWVLANGAIPEGLKVLHHCDNRRCVRPDHLFLGTLSDNTRDCIAKGRHYTPFREPGFHARIN